MVPQPVVRVPALPQWPATPGGLPDAGTPSEWNTSRDAWMAAFSERFLELRPEEDEETVHMLAADLWDDVGGHDPSIAAEMEHEATLGD